jgi:hypothetical protein
MEEATDREMLVSAEDLKKLAQLEEDEEILPSPTPSQLAEFRTTMEAEGVKSTGAGPSSGGAVGKHRAVTTPIPMGGSAEKTRGQRSSARKKPY